MIPRGNYCFLPKVPKTISIGLLKFKGTQILINLDIFNHRIGTTQIKN